MQLTATAKYLIIGFLLCFAALVYSPVWWVPFHLDDFTSIVENPYLLASQAELYLASYSRRLLTYSSFWLDYQLWGENAGPYHLVNVLVHLLSALALFLLSSSLFKYFQQTKTHHFWLAALVMAIFLIHPLNSQPVIYVVQRATLLATLFAFLSWYCWLSARVAERHSAVWFVLAVLSALAGCLSKEFAFLIPTGWLLLDLLIIKKPLKTLLLSYALPVMVIVAALAIGFYLKDASLWAFLDSASRETTAIARFDYWLTQQKILWLYYYKVLLPYPLLLEYPQTETLSLYAALPWFAAHLLLLSLAMYAYRLSPVITFTVLLCYVFHQVESGLIPITDLAFEHRAYAGNALLIMALVTFGYIMCSRYLSFWHTRLTSYVLLSLSLVFSGLTVQRAILWQSPIDLLKQNLLYAPEHYRLIHNIGLYYYNQQDYHTAQPLLMDAFIRARADGNNYIDYADSALMGLIGINQFSEAEQFVNQQVDFYQKAPFETSRLLSTYADAFILTGWYEDAIELLLQAQHLFPENPYIAPKLQFCRDKLAEKNN